MGCGIEDRFSNCLGVEKVFDQDRQGDWVYWQPCRFDCFPDQKDGTQCSSSIRLTIQELDSIELYIKTIANESVAADELQTDTTILFTALVE